MVEDQNEHKKTLNKPVSTAHGMIDQLLSLLYVYILFLILCMIFDQGANEIERDRARRKKYYIHLKFHKTNKIVSLLFIHSV